MKKWIIPVIASAVVVTAAAGVFFLSGAAKNRQAEVYNSYMTMRQSAEQTALTVTENGQSVGTYSLAEMGLLEDTLAAVNGQYGAYDRMEPAEFAELPLLQRLKWQLSGKTQSEETAVVTDHADMSEVLADLQAAPRQAAQDAQMEFKDGVFWIREEVPGTEIDEQRVSQVLTEAAGQIVFDKDTPGTGTVELSDYDCYILPTRTAKDNDFDFQHELQSKLSNMTIQVNFHGETETLSSEQLQQLVSVSKTGVVNVEDAALDEIVAQWHQAHRDDGVPYLFSAQVGGIKPIDFLQVDYEVNKTATAQMLRDAICQLESAQLEAQWYCWRKGEAFAIEGEYVEVDIPNQKMTYVKDGEVLVCTDVVTGAAWGYPTPPGYYQVENKDTSCWLEGPDYRVHVDYWIGFIGYEYGIHDADWRTKFGGTNYVKNGSHGCVNTPKEATATIFDNIEVGVPVLVYGK